MLEILGIILIAILAAVGVLHTAEEAINWWIKRKD